MATRCLTRQQLLCVTLIILAVRPSQFAFGIEEEKERSERLLPTVVIATLVRNKAHTLPWFLGLIENLDYPKDRIGLWIYSDHNIDNSTAMLREWLDGVSESYHSIEVKIDEKKRGYTDEDSPLEWTEKRMSNVIHLRQKALDYARSVWADYIFMVDADVTLENRKVLQLLMAQNKLVIAPLLNSSTEGLYSNFWGGMSDKGFYIRTKDYPRIIGREVMGVFPVPNVHTAFLIDLHHWGSPYLSYIRPPPGYKGPRDDIIIFAHSVKAIGETMHLINTEYFGKAIVPMDQRYTLDNLIEQFDFVKLEAMVEEVPPLYSSPHIHVIERPKDKMGFDEVYMINLERRPARKYRMMKAFDYLGIDAKLVAAVDGKQLNDTFLEEKGIKMLPGFTDPYHGRSMTMGEIGCFLSHYYIWEEMVEKGYEKIVVFEDDVRFEAFFRKKFSTMMEEVAQNFPSWDLIYLGRKRLRKDLETMVAGSSQLAWPHYSYWTISYILSNQGARKLLAQEPLTKMVPVDEYLPIMFDKHPEDKWRLQFYPRDLLGLSADPFLVYPTHYTGEPNYISDTEDSAIIPQGDKGLSKEELAKRAADAKAQNIAEDPQVELLDVRPEIALKGLQAVRTKEEL